MNRNILIGQLPITALMSGGSRVAGFKKRILFTVILHVYLDCIAENEKGRLVVVSVTSLHPPASSNSAIKMGGGKMKKKEMNKKTNNKQTKTNKQINLNNKQKTKRKQQREKTTKKKKSNIHLLKFHEMRFVLHSMIA